MAAPAQDGGYSHDMYNFHPGALFAGILSILCGFRGSPDAHARP